MSPPTPLPNFLDLLLDTVFVVDLEGKVVYVSAACHGLLGYTPQELIGRTMIDLITPEDRERTREEAARVMSGASRSGFENRYIHKNGKLVHIMWSARFSEADQLRIGVARDVTERRLLEARQSATYAVSEAAQRSEDLPALFQEVRRIVADLVPVASVTVFIHSLGMHQPSLLCDIDHLGNNHTTPNGTACHCHERAIASGSLIPIDPTDTDCPTHPASARTHCTALAMPLATSNRFIGAVVITSQPDTHFSEQDLELLKFVSDQVATAVERKQLHTELLKLARYDELTGLPNRRFFNEQVADTLQSGKSSPPMVGLLFIDLDDFKQVNDSYGHGTGDKLLREVANRLSLTIRKDDSAYRLGGDEFVVLLPTLHRREDAIAAANNLHRQLEQPFHIDGQTLRIKASVGVAVYPDDGKTLEPLLRSADETMYRNKIAAYQARFSRAS